MIYFKGEKPVNECQVGDITMNDGRYVKVESVNKNANSMVFTYLSADDYFELIRGLFDKYDYLSNKYDDLLNKVTQLDSRLQRYAGYASTTIPLR